MRFFNSNGFVLATFYVTMMTSLMSAKECIDGTDNVITIHDILNENKSISFDDVKILTYGADGKPLCKPKITFPGFVKIASGTISVTDPLQSDGNVKIALTVEQNSFMVGKVCENGKSKNSFVPSEMCNVDICAVAPVLCKLFEETHSISTTDLPSDYTGYIPIGAFDFAAIAGDWKASLNLIHNDKVVAAVRIGDGNKWITIALGGDRDKKNFEKAQKKLKQLDIKEEL